MNRKKYNESTADTVNEFLALLEKHSDDPQSVFVFTNLLRGLVRKAAMDDNLPIIEFMTVLKHERPIVFYHMKKQTEKWIQMLTHIDMNIEEAKEKINRLKVS